MAFDKLVDSAALEANLKTVADAIREKAGTSDALAFPAGFAEAIAAISAGGGGDFNRDHADIACGSFVVAEGKMRVLVECGFLSTPAEETRLISPDYQTRLALCLASAYLTQDESEKEESR